MCRPPVKPKRSKKIKHIAWTRMPSSPLSRMKLDLYQHTAADEILTAFRMANGLPVSRDPDLGIPARDPQFDDADEHMVRQSDLVRVYTAWRHDLRGTDALRVVDAVMFAEVPLLEIDATRVQRKGTAREHLAVGLKHFSALRGNVPAGVRDWKYEAKPPTTKGKTNV